MQGRKFFRPCIALIHQPDIVGNATQVVIFLKKKIPIFIQFNKKRFSIGDLVVTIPPYKVVNNNQL